jgi:hypothetical protein
MEVQQVSGTGGNNDEVMNFRAGYFQLSPEHVAVAIYIGPPKDTISQLRSSTSLNDNRFLRYFKPYTLTNQRWFLPIT